MSELKRRVGCHLVIDVRTPVSMYLKVAVAQGIGATVDESLHVTQDGEPSHGAGIIVSDEGSTCVLQIRQPGRVVVDYQATVTSRAGADGVSGRERMIYLRPSRYAESDRLVAVARAEFAGITAPAELLAAVSSWVGTRLSYVPGSSGPTDGAVDTLLLRQGVCRDYAHLVIALLRALDVPARMAAVYAPGLHPMDFHAVAEAAIDHDWWVVDATTLAPRSTLLRIATGRDAADTAFLSTYGGIAQLVETSVTAVVDGMLPDDDVTELISLT